MKISKLVGERIKEMPAGTTSKSQAYLIRAGFIKQVSGGIYSLFPPAQKISLKIQNIIREEMNDVGGQEVLFPVVMPKELWDESGRYTSIGSEMIRFEDRTGHKMLLGMTHEEASVHMCKNVIKSYDQLPFMIYQIQTKFRDEARVRAGLIRVKEFTMKDAYSFHTSQEDLEKYYDEVKDAYFRIFDRVGLKKYIAVASDTGMMGGSLAHEFMSLVPIGEDTLVLCDKCGYKANMEIAVCDRKVATTQTKPIEEVYTGKAKTIEEVCQYLNIKPEQTCKAVCYAIAGNNEDTLIVFIRGDLEVNEAKLKNHIGAEVMPIDLGDTGLVKGNIGALNINVKNIKVVYDKSLENETCLVTGANKEEYHIANVCPKRDFDSKEYVDVSKVNEGELCPHCKEKLSLSRGVEIGNIFQLGTKYTKSMNMRIHTPDGKEMYPIMGCYGIGIGRLLACVAEEFSDDKGLVWPMNIAPWQVYLCPLRINDEKVKQKSDELYDYLMKNNIDVLYDDRDTSAGIKFSDSELIGVPIRIVISPRQMENNEVELMIRQTGEKINVPEKDLLKTLQDLIKKA